MPLTQIYEKFQFTLSNGATLKCQMCPLLEPKRSPRESAP